jgi:hypothetical protein
VLAVDRHISRRSQHRAEPSNGLTSSGEEGGAAEPNT